MTIVKNTGGAHNLKDGTVVPHGGTFEYEGDFAALCKTFPNKFERVVEEAAPAPAPVQTPPATQEVTAEGNDVTADFPEAVEGDLIVLKDKKGWHVWDEGDEPINDKPLKKKDVAGAIAAYLAD